METSNVAIFKAIIYIQTVRFIVNAIMDDHIWKVELVEFEGSSTGTAVFEKKDLGIFSAVEDPWSPLSEFNVYPNPSINEVNISYALKNPSSAMVKLQIYDSSGRFIDQYTTQGGEGLNVFTFRRDNFISGTYFIRLMVGEQSLTGPMKIK